MPLFNRPRRRAGVANRVRRPVLETLETRALLSVGAIELGPSDNIALDQPRVAIELLKDMDPDPNVERWESVGPGVFNTFLLDTGANSVLAMATAVSDMLQPPLAYQTEGEFVEVGVGGDHPMDISASYRFDFAGTSGIRNTLPNTRILSDADKDFSMFGPWGIVGMPAMANRVTTIDMSGWSGGGVGLDDLYMKVDFVGDLPAGEEHRYALSVDNRVAFDPLDYLVSGEPPVWADIPFLTAIPTQNGVGAEGNFLFDTGAQISLISQHLAIAIGLDSNGDGLLDQNDDAYLGSETIGGVGGQTSVPVFAIDELRVPVTKVSTGEVVELVWTDLQWLVLDIDLGEGKPPLDGVFGSDLLTSGWFYSFFYPGMPDGYINQIHLDFREWDLYTGSMESRSGTVYFDLNPGVDEIVMPGPGIRLRETSRSTEVVKGVTTDTYTLALETVPLAPVEITVTADARTLVSSDGGATFVSTLVLVLDDKTGRTITVAAVDDGLIEGPQTGRITHTVASADADYHNMPVRDVTVQILDNRSVVTITADQAGENVIDSIEVAEGGGLVTYWLRLSEPPTSETWVLIEEGAGQVIVFNPNNTLGDGFENVWTFSSGNWSQPQPVRLAAVDDSLKEGPHQTQLVHTVLDLGNPLDPIVGQNFLTVHIADNDLGGVIITETGGSTHLAEGGTTDTYQIALATVPTGPVEITVTADSQTEISTDGGLTYAATLVLTYHDAAPQTITVRAVDDWLDEGTHSGRITHAITGAVVDPMYPASLPIAPVTATITDNDSAGIAISADSQGQTAISSIHVAEGDEVRYWVTLASQPKHDVTIFLGSTGGQVTAVDDAHADNAFLRFTPLDWRVPQAVRVSAIADGVVEGAHTDHIAHNLFSSDPKYQGTILLTAHITEAVENAVPLVASLTATPSPVTRPGEITLTAEGVSDPDGSVARVEFYRGDLLLGIEEDGSDGWSLAVATAGWGLGEHTFSARAQDDDGAWSEPATTAATVENAAPLVAALTASPNAVTRPGEITLTAEGVSDPDGSVARVEFYRGDLLLGIDEDGSDGWSLAVATAVWGLGEHTFSSRAQDNDDEWSEPATTAATVENAAPLVAALTASPNPVTRPGEITLTAEGVSDPDGLVARVEFYRDDLLLGIDENGSDGWSLTGATAGWSLGEHTFSARAQDNDDAWSEPATTAATVEEAALDRVDFLALNGLDLSAGSLYYGFSTAHTGFLTVEVIAPTPPKSARIRLYSENPEGNPNAVPLATSDLLGGNQRVDWMAEAGQAYYVEFYGANPQFDARIANQVHHQGTTVSVHGTEGDDTFEFDAGRSRNFTINGVKYAFADEEVSLVRFAGGAGYDTVVMHDSPGDDRLEAWSDRATFRNSAGDAVADFTVNVSEFAEMHVYATSGGLDTAALYDHPQGEAGSTNTKFKSEPAFGHVKLYGGGPYTRVKFFDVVDVYSTGGNDLARLFGSEGDDTFEGQMGLSRLYGPGYDVRVHNFPRVVADARQGGTDIARLMDSALKDEFHGKPHKSELFDQVTAGSVYKITARGFATVYAEASNREGPDGDGGRDEAALWDTARDDLVESSGDWLRFYQVSQQRLLYELLAFEFVKIRESSGGNDRTELTQPIDFLLEFDQGWEG